MNNTSPLLWAAMTLIIAPGGAYPESTQTGVSPQARVNGLLGQIPLIDGHNDLAWQIRDCFGGLDNLDLDADTGHLPKPTKALEFRYF